MVKKIIITLGFFISTQSIKAQVRADSLIGTYAGKYWLANPSTNPWVITNDTLYVTSIDTVNCIVSENDPSFGGNYALYTDYYSCNGIAPSNSYAKFYSGDSVRFITDNYPQPPPFQTYSFRFYGKRIGPYHSAGIKEFASSKDLIIYPNPASSNIQVTANNKEVTEITIFDVLGNKLLQSKQTTIDISTLPNGVYFLRVDNSLQKLVIQH